MRLLRSSSIVAALVMTAAAVPPTSANAYVSFGISVYYAPPPLPIYAQPPCPGPDFLWIPGYWAWDEDFDDYFWVPGTWVLAPEPGLLWTPAWWGWSDGLYIFHAGYWGRHVGFYGGIDYGFGYDGFGYDGGYWNGDQFFYNRSVNNVTNINITNVYYQSVTQNNHFTTASFNGPGGASARPTSAQLLAAREPHIGPTSAQARMVNAAAGIENLHAAVNHGVPVVAASAHPGEFRGPGVTGATGARGFYRRSAGDLARQAEPPGAPFQPGASPNRERTIVRDRQYGSPGYEAGLPKGPGREFAPHYGAPAAPRDAWDYRGRHAPAYSAAGPAPDRRGVIAQDHLGHARPMPQEGTGPRGQEVFTQERRGGGPMFGQEGPASAGRPAFMGNRGYRGSPEGVGSGPPPPQAGFARRPPQHTAQPQDWRGSGKDRGPQG